MKNLKYDINKVPISFLDYLYWESIGKEGFEIEYLDYIQKNFDTRFGNTLYLIYLLELYSQYSGAVDILERIIFYYWAEFDYFSAFIYAKKLKDLYPNNIFINSKFITAREFCENEIEFRKSGDFKTPLSLTKRIEDIIKGQK